MDAILLFLHKNITEPPFLRPFGDKTTIQAAHRHLPQCNASHWQNSTDLLDGLAQYERRQDSEARLRQGTRVLQRIFSTGLQRKCEATSTPALHRPDRASNAPDAYPDARNGIGSIRGNWTNRRSRLPAAGPCAATRCRSASGANNRSAPGKPGAPWRVRPLPGSRGGIRPRSSSAAVRRTHAATRPAPSSCRGRHGSRTGRTPRSCASRPL